MSRGRGTNVLLGIDLQSVDEVEESVTRFGERYTTRLFTEHELDCCRGDSRTIAQGLAGRFAAKEAVIKALGGGEDALPWRSIELRRGLGGAPSICLSGAAEQLARRRGVRDFSVSLSHDRGLAVAAVIAHAAPRRFSGVR